MIRVIIFIIVLVLSGCNSDDKTKTPVLCTTEARAGIEVIVKDASDNEALLEEVTVTIKDQEYTETLQNITPGNVFVGAYERMGTYSVTASKKGYKTNTIRSVIVDKDVCHVITETVEIFLEKIL